MKNKILPKIIFLISVSGCQSNTVYYRAVQDKTLADLQGYYLGTSSELIFVTDIYVELSEKSGTIKAYNDIKGASFKILQEVCKPETKTYNFGNRIFLYQCPRTRIFRTEKGIYAQFDRLGEIPYEPKGITTVQLEKVSKEQYDASLKEREDTVKSTKDWYKRDEFLIEAWSFEAKYSKYEAPIREKLAEIKKKYKYDEAKKSMTTDQLLDIEHEIGLEIHSFVIRTYR